MDDRQDRAFTPIAYNRPALWTARALFALAVWLSFPAFTSFTDQPVPVGLAHFVNFTWLGDTEPLLFGMTPLVWVRTLLAISLLVYLTGFLDAATLAVAAFATISIGTLNNSQGAMTHHLQVVALPVAALWVHALVRLGIGPRLHPFRWSGAWLSRERWSLFVAQQAVVGAYVVSAITKLVNSGGRWPIDAVYFPLQLVKTDRSEYYNTLQEQAGSGEGWANALAASVHQLFLDSPNTARFILTLGLLLELLAFLALAGKRWNLAVGLLIILFHLTVSKAMNLTFGLNMLVLTAFFVAPPVVHWVTNWSQAATRRSHATHHPKHRN